MVIDGEIDTKTKESQHVKSKLNNEKRRAIAVVNTFLGCNQRKIIWVLFGAVNENKVILLNLNWKSVFILGENSTKNN